ncbi:nhaP [Symbiodinium necroappetens]|uniref:NhaP protein n=1 Tax=Symbiodinium necroappetens TaxID=1628268 RepID=A0A812J6M4_9DINO|nr:nhaP [Symbiodinium necroappetens]
MTLAISEPTTTAVVLLIFGVLIAFSVLFTRALDRLGVPVVLLFLLLGMMGGSEGLGGLSFENYEVAYRLGTIALVLILFDGGLNTAHTSILRSLAPASTLATIGVFGTAGIVAVFARLFGLSWPEALLIGAIVSSTDAAAVFSVLRGGSLRVREPARSTIEVESCINDPMAIILTVSVVEYLRVGGGFSPWAIVEVPLQLLIGGVVGAAIGFASRWLLNRITLSTTGLFPVATLGVAFLAYGLSTIAHGSGFLGVFAAASVLGNGPLPYKSGLTRVHDAVAWFAQVSMFLMLGLLAFPSRLVDVAGVGMTLGLVLAFVARPVAAMLCVIPFGWKRADVIFTAWTGIRGAVPIVLATIPILAEIPGAERVFDIVFFIVVVSAIVPGASIVPLSRRLKMLDDSPAPPSATLEIHSRKRMDGEIHVYRVTPDVAVCGASLSEIVFPEHASVVLIVRGDEPLAARGVTRLREGDYVYVLCRHEDEPRIGLLFGAEAEL